MKIAPPSQNTARRLRLQLIDAMLTRRGFIRREHLCQAFDLSPASATRDLRIYRDMNGQHVRYNQGERRWEATLRFHPAKGLLNHMPADEFIDTLERLFDIELN